jgi:hypothetical protein
MADITIYKRAEFALTFGNFKVSITVPADHIIAATGECQNYKSVLHNTAKALATGTNCKGPIEVITLEEALQASKTKSTAKKTWVYKADKRKRLRF